MDTALDHAAVASDGSPTVCLLHRLFEVSDQLVAITDLDGAIITANPAWTLTLGWPREQLLGHRYLEVVHPDDTAPTTAQLRRIAAGEHLDAFDARIRHVDGTYLWLRWSVVADADHDRLYAVVRDVTGERRRQARLEEIERVSGVGTWDLDLGTQTTNWSAGVHAIYATDPATFRPGVDDGMRCYPPAAQATLAPAFERLRTTGVPYDLELPFVTMRGEDRWIRTTGRAQLRDDQVVSVFGSFQDITDLRRRQEQLASAHEQLASAHEQLTEAQRLARLGHFRADLDAGTARWTPMVFDIFGLPPHDGDVDSAVLFEAVHPDDRDVVDRALQQAITDGSHDVVHRIVRPDGAVRTIRTHGHLRPSPDGTTRHLHGMVQDITDLAAVQEALRTSEQRLRRVLTATNDGWWDTDLATGSVVHSDRWLAIHGYSPGEVPDTYDSWRELTPPEDLRTIDAVTDAVMARREPTFTVSARARHKDGHLVPVVIRGLIDYDGEGRPVRISGATTDVSELRRAEEAKEAFVSNVSHELRTPLTSIGGALDTLEAGVAGPLPPDIAGFVELAQRNTARLRALIDDLLDIEGLTSGRTTLTIDRHRLLPLVERALADIAPLTAGHGTTVAITRTVDAWVDVDPLRIGQVLANLLSNAARFAPAGSVIELRLRTVDDRVVTEVIDTGAGIPVSFQPRMFERFAQADPTEARSRGGTGLGLPISKEIVERLSGQIGFSSRPGRTCVWFDLPMST